MIVKNRKTIKQYKICELLSDELDLNIFRVFMLELNIVKIMDIIGSEMFVKYEKNKFKTEFI